MSNHNQHRWLSAEAAAGQKCTGVATKWHDVRLQEAAQGWTAEGTIWWCKLAARLDQWAKDDLLRAQHKNLSSRCGKIGWTRIV